MGARTGLAIFIIAFSVILSSCISYEVAVFEKGTVAKPGVTYKFEKSRLEGNHLPDVHGDYVTFIKSYLTEGDKVGQIFLANMKTGEYKQITESSREKHTTSLSEEHLVWQEEGEESFTLVRYDLSSGLTEELLSQKEPLRNLNFEGKYAVWEERKNDSQPEIYLLDMESEPLAKKKIGGGFPRYPTIPRTLAIESTPHIGDGKVVFLEYKERVNETPTRDYYIYYKQVWIYDLEDDTLKPLFPEDGIPARVWDPKYSNGKVYYFAVKKRAAELDWDIYEYDVDSGEEKVVVGTENYERSFDVNGQYLFYKETDERFDSLRVVDLGTGVNEVVSDSGLTIVHMRANDNKVVWNIFGGPERYQSYYYEVERTW